GSSGLLALEGPRRVGSEADLDQDDLHTRRHLENERALQEAEAEEEAATGQHGRKAEGEGAAPSAGLPAHPAAKQLRLEGRGGGAEAAVAAEEEDFDEALHSSELQPLAQALGGAVAEAATAPLQPRRAVAADAGPAADAAEGEAGPAVGGQGAAEAAAAAGGDMVVSGSDGKALVGGDGGGGEGGGAPSEAAAAATQGTGAGTGEARIDVAAAMEPDAAAAAAAPAHGGEPGGGEPGGGGAGPGPGAGVDEDEEEGEADQLSDVCDEDISAYLATREEASVRETLWVEMNKEWIEKQEVKKAAEAAANDPSRPASDKSRRKYVRKTAPLEAQGKREDQGGRWALRGDEEEDTKELKQEALPPVPAAAEWAEAASLGAAPAARRVPLSLPAMPPSAVARLGAGPPGAVAATLYPGAATGPPVALAAPASRPGTVAAREVGPPALPPGSTAALWA
ncbi:hypothetical protein TSOC_014330, partial [Tetrabaena socialis]